MNRDATSMRMVVPLDGSDFATRAIPAAAAIARAAGAGVDLVALAPDGRERALMSQRVHEAAQLLPPTIDVDEQVVVDLDPVAALLRTAAHPDRVLCLASHDHMPAVAAVLASVGSHVIEQAVRPLLVVGASGEATAAGTDIVVAVDGQHDPEPLLAVAVRWARLLDAPLRVVTVYEPVLADIRRPEHFTRSRGPSIDVELYLEAVRGRVEGSGLRSVDVASIPDPVSVADGLSDHLTGRPALMLVVGGEHHPHLAAPGVLRRLLRALALPVLLVPRPSSQATTVRDAEGRSLSDS